ncbi:GCK domain-containing protein [Plasmodiophora brassicae]|uniref:GCK domain-containing protein n=1 Tax=Plasmodiophora brassicae TaxID=37360 RepID=A0A0G4IVZ7_PLABS|nr:hypothetical protein PBRA_001323 [Plasmodiophora brassicae]SPQ97422.1 unnamed protein product [Plasmodiophora brassicae]
MSRALIAAAALGAGSALVWQRARLVACSEAPEPVPDTVSKEYIDSLDLDWDGKSIEELAADEKCPPCFRSELLGPCGSTFAPAYKCFRLCEIEKKDIDVCRPLMKAYADCMNAHPERYNALFDDDEDAVRVEDAPHEPRIGIKEATVSPYSK